jgi:hypothetical protein
MAVNFCDTMVCIGKVMDIVNHKLTVQELNHKKYGKKCAIEC